MMYPKPKHKRRVPKRSERGKFNAETRRMISERDQQLCQMCFKKGTEIHHVMYKSRGGRGVYTNGLTLCQSCHRKVHDEAELSEYWINVFTDRYGSDFYKDGFDEQNDCDTSSLDME